jgi:hypothetical protein
MLHLLAEVCCVCARQQEFVKAVEAWRKSNVGPVDDSATFARTGTGTGQETGTETGTAMVDSAKALAETLAQALDKEQQALQRNLQQQKEQAQQRLAQANAELKQMRLKHDADARHQQQQQEEKDQTNGIPDIDDSLLSDAEAGAADESSRSYAPHDLFAQPPSSSRPILVMHDQPLQAPVSTVRVALLESVLGQLGGDADSGASCRVEEVGSDDERA